MRPVFRSAVAAATLLAGLVCPPGASRARAAGEPVAEHEVKATFLFNFLKFSTWPAVALGEGRPLEVCIFGESAITTSLQTFSDQTVDGHRLKVRPVVDPADLQFCHVVFFTEGEERRTTAVLATLGGAPVLTVGEQPAFLDRGGMIGFVSEDKRVRFDINQAAAERANVKISAHLLRLARRTVGRKS